MAQQQQRAAYRWASVLTLTMLCGRLTTGTARIENTGNVCPCESEVRLIGVDFSRVSQITTCPPHVVPTIHLGFVGCQCAVSTGDCETGAR